MERRPNDYNNDEDSSGNSSLSTIDEGVPEEQPRSRDLLVGVLAALVQHQRNRRPEADLVTVQVNFMVSMLRKIKSKRRQMDACEDLQKVAKSYLTDADLQD